MDEWILILLTVAFCTDTIAQPLLLGEVATTWTVEYPSGNLK